MIEHEGYYYFLRPITGVYGKIRWSVIKRPVTVSTFGGARNPRIKTKSAVTAIETPEDEVLATGLTTEEADNFLKLLR